MGAGGRGLAFLKLFWGAGYGPPAISLLVLLSLTVTRSRNFVNDFEPCSKLEDLKLDVRNSNDLEKGNFC